MPKKRTKSAGGRGGQKAKSGDPGLQKMLAAKIADLSIDDEADDVEAMANKLADTAKGLLPNPDSDADSAAAGASELDTQRDAIVTTVKAWKERNAANRQKTDATAHELQRVTAVKEKLEALCRELQKQNKNINESEHLKREELTNKFQESISDIAVKLEQQAEDSRAQQSDNEILRQKLEILTKQAELREQQFAAEFKAKGLEAQLLEAKLAQQTELAQQAVLRCEASTAAEAVAAKTEATLREQLAMYADKFSGFQDTLTSSNDMFNTFKKQMAKMTKTIKKLEKENAELRKKCSSTDVALINLTTEKAASAKQVETLTTAKDRLGGLCRTLQQQLKEARDKIKELELQHSGETEPVGETA
eukprot:SAG11_NODE_37_length_21777_cov_4.523711_1_plen_363_part_00